MSTKAEKLAEVFELCEAGTTKDDILEFVRDNCEILEIPKKYSAFEKFLRDNNISFKKETFRDVVLREFKKNSKLSKEELRTILTKSSLKQSRVEEYIKYYYDLWYNLANINSQEEPES